MIGLSFIVPFYNVEPYIEECIRSLYDQDIPMEEYEVICVDDCSPDDSRAIVERLQKEYPTLRLICHTENKRQGGARNTGLIEARGKYIWFVDSDDYIKPNCLQGLLELAEKENLDLLKFNFPREEQHGQRLYSSPHVVSGSALIFEVEKNVPLLIRCCSAVQQIIRREFLRENNILFVEKVQYEDDDFTYQLYASAERCYLVAESPYIVRYNPNSTTRRKHDLCRAQDIYSQALRMADLDTELTMQDSRWHTMIVECIDDCINNCVFRILKDLSFSEQIHFWLCGRRKKWKLKPYLSRKSYAKLCSYTLWRMLQK